MPKVRKANPHIYQGIHGLTESLVKMLASDSLLADILPCLGYILKMKFSCVC